MGKNVLQAKKKIRLFSIATQRTKMRSHKNPSMDALDANVENPEDKFLSKTEYTSG